MRLPRLSLPITQRERYGGRGRDHTALSHSLPLLLSQVASGMRPSGNAGHANGCWSRVFARRDSWVQHRLALLHFIEAQAARVGVVRVYVRVCMSVHVCVLVCLRCHNKILTQWFINKRAPHSTTKSARVRANKVGRLRRRSNRRRERRGESRV